MDPEQLWLTPTRARVGRPPAHTRAEIVAAAVALADAEGAAAVTMRRVAARIGAGTMSLYTYVPDKETLLELMIDHAGGARPLPEPTGDWHADLRALAHTQREIMLAHPWLPGVLPARRTLGPNTLRTLEHALAVLEPAGLAGAAGLEVFSLLTGFVASHTAYEIAQRDVAGDAQAQARYLHRAVEDGSLPHLAAALASPDAAPPGDTFDRLLARMIDGLVP
ncbi:TetR/AcrR family transcriptional regulator C-terminal domain-containing protein [Actinomadura macrotermitis]|uniref:HTH tetR-type domain-containing protein n=1 Tax=Actinomadura macrotermitis TaxID=2585200 RepID=A0A7K0BXA1_9ACTN|nr:TetR/AcrR family transcriptional regulator C-terminal domain-containing protein [Actinomadura macrotermitis]MQY05808.1 hypothetical protein [Actinomadura macrotermitis]